MKITTGQKEECESPDNAYGYLWPRCGPLAFADEKLFRNRSCVSMWGVCSCDFFPLFDDGALLGIASNQLMRH